MYATRPYQRLHAVEYAKKWALDRNPLFQDFAGCGGDCTNFISQCLFAGSCIMNDTPTFGWYFRAPGDYAPAWTGIIYLYNFLTSNMGNGPTGVETDIASAELGDLIQLGRQDGTWYHTVIVTGMQNGDLLVSAHNNDALDRPLSSYTYDAARCIHITGVRFSIPAGDCCFDGMLDGTSIFPTPQQTAAMACYPAVEPGTENGMENETPAPRPADILPGTNMPETQMEEMSAGGTGDLAPGDM